MHSPSGWPGLLREGGAPVGRSQTTLESFQALTSPAGHFPPSATSNFMVINAFPSRTWPAARRGLSTHRGGRRALLISTKPTAYTLPSLRFFDNQQEQVSFIEHLLPSATETCSDSFKPHDLISEARPDTAGFSNSSGQPAFHVQLCSPHFYGPTKQHSCPPTKEGMGQDAANMSYLWLCLRAFASAVPLACRALPFFPSLCRSLGGFARTAVSNNLSPT